MVEDPIPDEHLRGLAQRLVQRRNADEKEPRRALLDLLNTLVMAVRIDRPGTRWWDYHTVGAGIGMTTAGGGVEDYRWPKPRITGENSVIGVPSGDYLLRCHIREETEVPMPSWSEVEAKALSPEDRAYYHSLQRRDNWRAIKVLSSVLLFPVLWAPLGWKIALAIALGAMLVFGGFLARRWEHQPVDERWKRINDLLGQAMLGGQLPWVILELRRMTDATGLAGGAVRL